MAYIRVTKPKSGLVDIEFDDHRGRTAYRARAKGVPKGQVGATVGPMYDEFSRRRADISAVRKGVHE